ncbi:MAG: hypothetical protein HYZ73_09825, partial [Elusimicrobia bacterium]|nr:hypothetical protein [Elusimicrobiota bacterium]
MIVPLTTQPMASAGIPNDLVHRTIRDLTRRGADYADVRYEQLLHESLVAEHDQAKSISLSESAGIGIRVLIHGSWGFAATPHLSLPSLKRAAAQAVAIAKASASINKKPLVLTACEPAKAVHRATWRIDPFEVPLSQKLDYLLWATTSLLGPKSVKRATGHMDFYKHTKYFAS